MIGSVDWFGETFGSVPEGDIEWNARIAKAMIRQGLAVVIIKPNDKTPACTLNATDAKRANNEAQDAAKERGNPGWDRVIHPCGTNHALTEERQLTRVHVKRLLAEGANLAIAVGKGSLRVAVADLDTTAQIETFRALCESHEDTTTFDSGLTVASPGVFRETDGEGKWIHKDGGHKWFFVPEDMELPESKGRFSWCPCHQYRITIDDPETPGKKKACEYAFALYWGTGYVLVPPSVRPEGPYRLTGEAVELPDWLAVMARSSVPERKTSGSTGFLGSYADGDDPIDAWAESISWEEILTGYGFTPAGVDTCGCPTYTRPGDSSHSKSVTGHEIMCSYYDGTGGQAPIHIWSDSVLSGEGTMSKLNFIAEWEFDGVVEDAMAAQGIEGAYTSSDDIFGRFTSPKAQPPVTDHGGNSDVEESELSDDEFFGMRKAGSTGESDDDTSDDDDEDEGDYFDSPLVLRRVESEAIRQVIRLKAKELADEYMTGSVWTPPTDDDDLSVLLSQPRSEEKYAIEGILPIGGNAMLSAEYKSGKTTFIMELLRAFADQVPFLGKFPVKVSGNVGYWNLELSKGMMLDWLADTGIRHPENIKILNLRGQRIPLETKKGEEWAIEWLRSRNIRVWVVDPVVRQMIGWGSENENSDVTRFTDKLDEIKTKAGVQELIVAHHTGRAMQEAGQERARGATRWDDWPDARWLLTKEADSGTRFIRFSGRIKDELPERALTYDKDTRRVSMISSGDPWEEADRKTIKLRMLCEKVLPEIEANPGISQGQLMQATQLHDREVKTAVKALEAKGLIKTDKNGPRGAIQHFPATLGQPELSRPSQTPELEMGGSGAE